MDIKKISIISFLVLGIAQSFAQNKDWLSVEVDHSLKVKKHEIAFTLFMHSEDNCDYMLVNILNPICFGMNYGLDRNYFNNIAEFQDLTNVLEILEFSHIVIENKEHKFKFFCDSLLFISDQDYYIKIMDAFDVPPIKKDEKEGLYKVGSFLLFKDWLKINKSDLIIRFHLLYVPINNDFNNECTKRRIFTSNWFKLN
jgi:hypothetical protein